MTEPRFVVDTMLGRLAHWLRAMGYDTVYLRSADDHRLLQIAIGEDRILVTRDSRLARRAGRRSLFIQFERLDEQLAEVVARLGLHPPPAEWLSRCLECNALIEPRERDAVRGRVPPRIFDAHTEFWGCPGCGRIYWAGSHTDRMLGRLGRLLNRGKTG